MCVHVQIIGSDAYLATKTQQLYLHSSHVQHQSRTSKNLQNRQNSAVSLAPRHNMLLVKSSKDFALKQQLNTSIIASIKGKALLRGHYFRFTFLSCYSYNLLILRRFSGTLIKDVDIATELARKNKITLSNLEDYKGILKFRRLL